MKTILDIAKECGANDCKDIADDGSIMLNPDQLTATIETWNRRNSEPLRVEFGSGLYGVHHGIMDDKPCFTVSNKGSGVIGEKTNHQNMTTIESSNEIVTFVFNNKDSYDVVKKEFDSVYPLIDQPAEPPASQELMDRIAELEKSLTESIDYIDSFRWHWMNVPSFGDRINKTIREAITQAHNPLFLAYNNMQNALQSKPAKE